MLLTLGFKIDNKSIQFNIQANNITLELYNYNIRCLSSEEEKYFVLQRCTRINITATHR